MLDEQIVGGAGTASAASRQPDPRAGTQLTPDLYVEPIATSEPAPVEIDPALEERFAQFASGAASSANDEPARGADELLLLVMNRRRSSSAEAAAVEPAEAVAAPHSLVDSFLEAHFAGQEPADQRHVTPALAPAPVADSPFVPCTRSFARTRHRRRPRSWTCRRSTCPRRTTMRTCVDRVARAVAARQRTATSVPRQECLPFPVRQRRAHPAGTGGRIAGCRGHRHSSDIVAVPAQSSPVADTSVVSVPAAAAPAVVVAPVAAAAPAAAAPSPAPAVLERAAEPPKIRIRAEQPVTPVAPQTVAEPAAGHQAVAGEAKAARPARPRLAATPPAKSSAPAKASAIPNVPAAGRSRIATLGAAAAVIVVVAAIGFPLGKLWLGGHESSPVIREEPSAPAAATPAPTPRGITGRHRSGAGRCGRRRRTSACCSRAGQARDATWRRAPAAAKVPPKTAQPVIPVKPVGHRTASTPVVAAVPEVVCRLPSSHPNPSPSRRRRPLGRSSRSATSMRPRL